MVRKGVQEHPAEVYASQLELLERGCRAAGWACRKLLGLDDTAHATDVINAMVVNHDASIRLEPEQKVKFQVASIVAAAILLRCAPL